LDVVSRSWFDARAKETVELERASGNGNWLLELTLLCLLGATFGGKVMLLGSDQYVIRCGMCKGFAMLWKFGLVLRSWMQMGLCCA